MVLQFFARCAREPRRLRANTVGSEFSFASLRILFALLGLLVVCAPNLTLSTCGEDITFARPDPGSSISVSATQIRRWQVGAYEVLHLLGDVKIRQQDLQVASNEAIVWVEKPGSTESDAYKIITYLEGQVVIDLPRTGDPHQETGLSADRIVDEKWLGRFFTRATVDLDREAQPLGSVSAPEIFCACPSSAKPGSPIQRPADFFPFASRRIAPNGPGSAGCSGVSDATTEQYSVECPACGAG